jgi:hypothetical protein
MGGRRKQHMTLIITLQKDVSVFVGVACGGGVHDDVGDVGCGICLVLIKFNCPLYVWGVVCRVLSWHSYMR